MPPVPPDPPQLDPAQQRQAVTLAASLRRYGADRWGRDFLSANPSGHLEFRDLDGRRTDLHELAKFLVGRGIKPPYVVRFPARIEEQMRHLSQAFKTAASQHGYQKEHIGVYPLKVNQRRPVVETVSRARAAHGFGLEAGSKPELLLAMVQPPIDGSILICNGFKDHAFMRMAFHASELGHKVIVVLESRNEVGRFLDVLSEEPWTARPSLGVRAKLYSRGSGRWQSSGGEHAKFGLTTNEILSVIEELRDAGRLDSLELLHFHIGSQITQIKRIKRATREGIRLWGYLKRSCPAMTYLDLGGGIGVDYDGSRTSYPSSANYTLDEYASQVVYEVVAVAEEMELEQPTLVTESGRVLVANHAVTIADIREIQGHTYDVPDPIEDEHRLVSDLRYTLENITIKNIEEYFHDAVDYRDEVLDLFSRGYATLTDRAAAEALFTNLRLKVERLLSQMSRPPEELEDHIHSARHKFLLNFSLFQSLPDTWSIDQVFPAAPLSRHDERPSLNASIVDITCDSDGCVTSFAHPDENLRYLPLHSPRSDDPYYVGFFMTGAYQDSLSNVHNLFSRSHEVVVRDADADPLTSSEQVEFGASVLEVTPGGTNEQVLSSMDFDADTMQTLLRDRHLAAETTLGQRWAQGLLLDYPYLD